MNANHEKKKLLTENKADMYVRRPFQRKRVDTLRYSYTSAHFAQWSFPTEKPRQQQLFNRPKSMKNNNNKNDKSDQ
jgi:hypothetical protein